MRNQREPELGIRGTWWLIGLIWAVALLVLAVASRGQSVINLDEITNASPTCITAPLRAVVIFEAGSTVVWIDDEPVPEVEDALRLGLPAEDGWHLFADGRRFTTRPAVAVPELGGCQGPAVTWSDGVPEDAEAMRLYAVFVGGLIVFSQCDRYNTVIEPGETYRCWWVSYDDLFGDRIFADDFESGDLSAWSGVVP